MADEEQPDTELARSAPPPAPQPEQPKEPKKPRESRGVAVWTTVIAALAVAAAFLVFVAQNTDQVHVQWTVWVAHVSLAAVVFGAMLLGSALTLLVGAIWRVRRRRHLRMRRELEQLRSGRG